MELQLAHTLAACQQRHRKLLSLYVTAGYPRPEATLPLLQLLARSGADLIELGLPFSDPLADGPTIQRSSHQALQNGVNTRMVLEMAAAATHTTNVPVILMGYYNPLLQFGMREFIAAAAAARVQGLIIPDLPLEESLDLRARAAGAGLSLIYLVSPNTAPERVQRLAALTTSFIYAVSVTGVTGARANLADQAADFLTRLRSQVRVPVLVGFGVSSGREAGRLAHACDGVIVGSALLNCIAQHWGRENGEQEVGAFVRELRVALGEGDNGY